MAWSSDALVIVSLAPQDWTAVRAIYLEGIATGNSTFEKAARMGLGVLCFTIGGPESIKPLVELYKNEIQRAEPVGDFVNDNIMVTTQLLCLEDG